MQNRTVSALAFGAIAIVRIGFAVSSLHSGHHSTASAASPPTATATAMADARRQSDNIRASHGGEVISSDGTTRAFADNPADQAMRDRAVDRSEADVDSDVPDPEPTPSFVPGEPMMDPTPSR